MTIDVTEIKIAARGRWPEILRTLTPEFTEAIDAGGRHVHCPFPDHDDSDPSFRFDGGGEGRAICTCGSYDGLGLHVRHVNGTFQRHYSMLAAIWVSRLTAMAKPSPISWLKLRR